ncbi:MAG: hypothetical protein ACT4QG_08960 [Sporichthyaceae bacterium]
MGHKLVIWEGAPPADFEAGVAQMRETSRLYLFDEPVEPTPAIRRFVEALAEIWPDDPADSRWDDSPWKDSPLIECASGPSIYLDLTLGGGWRESNTIAGIGADYGLVTFDCMLAMVLPAAEAAVAARKAEMHRELAEALQKLHRAGRRRWPSRRRALEAVRRR